jgi:hypothetical protein
MPEACCLLRSNYRTGGGVCHATALQASVGAARMARIGVPDAQFQQRQSPGRFMHKERGNRYFTSR